jgi:predicted short-subunit dehydrogenase-like oxidoreductase (DUF2520 family)
MAEVKITIIGSGNVATYLAIAFKSKGYDIVQIYSPNNLHAKALAERVQAAPCSSVEQINPYSDFYVIAINDDALKSFSENFTRGDGIVIHTSGFHGIDVLKNTSLNYGVFYPLQTLNKNGTIPAQPFPICIEASNNETLQKIKSLAQSIDGDVHIISSQRRKVLHVAAVFANNFGNYMFSMAEKILQKEKISFGLLRPLIRSTAENVMHRSPAEVQTGPAKRGDEEILRAHIEILKDDPELKSIYELISSGIRKNIPDS